MGVAARSMAPALAVFPDGRQAALAWTTRSPDANEENVHLLVLDGNGRLIFDDDLPFALHDPQRLQLLTAAADLQLLWLDDDGRGRALWQAHLTMNGDVVAGPQQVSPAGTTITWFKPARLPDGDLLLLWKSGGALLAGRLPPDGAAIEGTTELRPVVINADFQLENDGRVHVVWSERVDAFRRRISYAPLDVKTLALNSPTQLAELLVANDGSNNLAEGPVLALGEASGYVTWVMEGANLLGFIRRMLQVAFPLPSAASTASPPFTEPYPVNLPPPFPPDVSLATPAFDLKAVAMIPERLPGTAAAGRDLVALPGQQSSAALALTAEYSTRNRQQYQPTVLYMTDGQASGYQVLTWTERPSVNPALAADANGRLYLAWVDALGQSFRYPVYLATTAPSLQAAWDSLTVTDYGVIAGEVANRAVFGVTLLPLTAMWIVAPFVVLLGYLWFSGGDVQGRRGTTVFFVTLLVYLGSKYIFTFEVLEYLPSVAFLPPTVETLLIFATPIFTLALALGLAWVLLFRRRDELPVVGGITLVILMDFALSLAIYGAGFYE